MVTNKVGRADGENYHGRLNLSGGQSIVGRETNDTGNVSTVVPAPRMGSPSKGWEGLAISGHPVLSSSDKRWAGFQPTLE